MTAEAARVPQCERTPQKIKYLSRHDAMHSRQRRTWLYLNPYLCTSCGYWHLTSQEATDQ